MTTKQEDKSENKMKETLSDEDTNEDRQTFAQPLRSVQFFL